MSQRGSSGCYSSSSIRGCECHRDLMPQSSDCMPDHQGCKRGCKLSADPSCHSRLCRLLSFKLAPLPLQTPNSLHHPSINLKLSIRPSGSLRYFKPSFLVIAALGKRCGHDGKLLDDGLKTNIDNIKGKSTVRARRSWSRRRQQR